MTPRLHYGTTAKVFHWTIVALLLVQYLIGWLMPDIHGGMKPGAAMTFHVSSGLVILALIALLSAIWANQSCSAKNSLLDFSRRGRPRAQRYLPS